MIKLAAGFTLTVPARVLNFAPRPTAARKSHRFKNYRHYNDEWGFKFKHEWARLIFSGFLVYIGKIVKKWFSCDKNYKSRAFCSGTRNSSTKCFSIRSLGEKSPPVAPRLKLHVSVKNIYIDGRENPLKFNFITLDLLVGSYIIDTLVFCSERAAGIEFIDFRPRFTAPKRCDFTTIIINIIMHFNQN